MKITFEQGSKSPEDRIILVDGHKISLEEVADWCISCCNFRDASEQDSLKFVALLNDCFEVQDVTDEILDRYYHTKFEEYVCKVAVEIYKNEERVYPQKDGFSGGEKLRDFLNECMKAGDVSDDIINQFSWHDTVSLRIFEIDSSYQM